jgi:hypothetical protein
MCVRAFIKSARCAYSVMWGISWVARAPILSKQREVRRMCRFADAIEHIVSDTLLPFCGAPCFMSDFCGQGEKRNHESIPINGLAGAAWLQLLAMRHLNEGTATEVSEGCTCFVYGVPV